jgi:Uma2 family endonuclease
MSLQTKRQPSFEGWLAGERASLDDRCEYVGGEVVAMSGGTIEHNAIISNIVRDLGNQMKGRPCQVFGSGLKLRVQAADAGEYPDLMALCSEPQFYDGRRDLLLNPSLIGEVLSSSTKGYDRGDKFNLYRRIPSLREYLLVAQHRVLVELYTRGTDGRWMLSSFEALADQVRIESIDCALTLAEVYDKVSFDTGGQLPERGQP